MRFLFIVLVIFLISGCSGGITISQKSIAWIKKHPYATKKSELIGVVDEGWHTGLILSANELNQPLNTLKHWFPKTTKYFVFGFGNRKYYMLPNPGLGTALAALFPSKSVMFVQGLTKKSQNAFLKNVKIAWICLSPIELQRLDVYIANYFTKKRNGKLIKIGKGLSYCSHFFKSPAVYDAFYTCNTWTANALHFSGLLINYKGVLFSAQIMSEINNMKSLRQISCKNR